MNRKNFLKTTSLGSLALSAFPIEFLSGQPQKAVDTSKSTPAKEKHVAVVGAGISGLSCAYELLRKGYEVTVLEASGRIGGTVLSVRDGLADGLYADFGAENFTRPGYQKYWEYIEEFNLPVLPYYHRENRKSFVNGEWVSDEQARELRKKEILKQGGLTPEERRFLNSNPVSYLPYLYVQPYLSAFIDEYQPFGIGMDHLDTIPISYIYKQEGASDAALRILGGSRTSALYSLWQTYIRKIRGYDQEFDLYRIRGGNQVLTDTLGKRIGDRIHLSCQVTEVRQGNTGVDLHYNNMGQRKTLSCDYMVSTLPVTALRNILFTPDLPPEKHFIIDNITYAQTTRVVFQARTKFWEEDGVTINLTYNHPSLRTIWQVAEEVDSDRAVLMAKAPGGTTSQQVLNAFKEFYPGDPSNITIEQQLIKDWSADRYTPGCERLDFPMGQLHQFWPHTMTPAGRIHFAGSYTDNRSWGMEAAINSAHRVVNEIDNL